MKTDLHAMLSQKWRTALDERDDAYEALHDVATGLHELDATRKHDGQSFQDCSEWHCQRAAELMRRHPAIIEDYLKRKAEAGSDGSQNISRT